MFECVSADSGFVLLHKRVFRNTVEGHSSVPDSIEIRLTKGELFMALTTKHFE